MRRKPHPHPDGKRELPVKVPEGTARHEGKPRASPHEVERMREPEVAFPACGPVRALQVADDDRLLTPQDPRHVEREQHALDPVGGLGHVLDEENAVFNLRHPRRARQRGDHRQIAAPEDALGICIVRVVRLPRRREGPAADDGQKPLDREGIRINQVPERRALPARAARPCQKRELEGRHVRKADEGRRRGTDPLPVEHVENASAPIAAAHRHDEIRIELCERTGQIPGPDGVGTCKARLLEIRALKFAHAKAERFGGRERPAPERPVNAALVRHPLS